MPPCQAFGAELAPIHVGLGRTGYVPLEKHGVRNGVAYTIESVGEDTVKLEGGIELSHEHAVEMLRLLHAMTYASVQGRETDGSLCLHDTGSVNFSHKHLYVSLSRAKEACRVRVQ